MSRRAGVAVDYQHESETLEAVYEQEVLRSLQHDLPEHKRVTVTISDVDRATAEAVTRCCDLERKAGMIGALKDAPSDLSTNSDHFQGFGTP
jgi:predicted DNA-binding antitoxin AbrB/MazE fold protein